MACPLSVYNPASMAAMNYFEKWLTDLAQRQTMPLRNVRLTIKGADVDPIKSNQMAFRHAGRDALRGDQAQSRSRNVNQRRAAVAHIDERQPSGNPKGLVRMALR